MKKMINTVNSTRLMNRADLLLRAFAIFLMLSIASVSLAQPADPNEAGISTKERLARLIDSIKWHQDQLETMQATFVQRKESMLLIEPEESTGSFWYQAPDKVRWDFETPNQTLVVVDGEQMLTWYRDLGTAERVNIGKQSARVMQYLSASNSLETLEGYFSLSISLPGSDDAPYKINLVPRFARIEKKIKRMTIDIDRQGYFPTRLRYDEPDGDVTELRFTDVAINEKLTDDAFEVELPDDIEIKSIELGSKSSD